MPISTKLFNDQAIARFNALTSDIQTVQGKIATGKQVLRASDDPVAAANISFVRDQKVVLERYQTNIDRARSRLNLTENAIADSLNLLTRAYELGVQARNDTLSEVDRRAIALEIAQIRESLVGFGNSKDGAGNHLFSGYKSSTSPFVMDESGEVKFAGDRGAHSVQISETLRTNAGLDGAAVFMRVDLGGSARPMFDILKDMEDELNGGVMNDKTLAELNGCVDHFAVQQTMVGAELSKLDVQQPALDRRVLLMEETLSGLEDADLAKLVTDLQSKIVTRDAAQQAFVKIGQQTLFDYIR